MVAIGIDLGTSNSCVGIWQNGSVQIIPNDQGDRKTPSYIAFTEYERLIGDLAKNQSSMNPSNTVFDVKRIIGRNFQEISEESKNFPFAVINEAGKPKINILYKNEWKVFTPEEITAMILTKLKQNAESYLGHIVKNAVISVPASFSDSQRRATKNAAKIAGLNVLRLINEPTASALAYGLDKNIKGEKKALIFDLGGGKLDISVISIDDGSLFEVLSTSGNTQFGGIDFDNKLVNYLIQIFENNYKKNLRTNPRAIRRLRTAAEKAKISLSYSNEVSIEIEALYEGIDFFTVITRKKFEELCADLFRNILIHLEKALNEANVNKCAIDDVIFVGGSTRIPKIQKLIKNYFFGKRINSCINPDEAVAFGASIQAAILNEEQKIKNLLLVDVIPKNLGLEIEGIDEILTIIQKNTRIPCKKTFFLPTFNGISFRIFEESKKNLLGSFNIHGIHGEAQKIKIILDIDADGILDVSADLNGKKIAVKQEKNCLSSEEIIKMAVEEEEYRREDEKQRKCIEIRNILEGQVLNLKRCDLNLSDSDRIQLKMICDEVLVWLETNIQAEVEDYEEKITDFVSLCNPILKNCNLKYGRCFDYDYNFNSISM